MRGMFVVGLLLVILGLASLFVAIPQRERHGIEVGGASVGVETKTSRKVAPVVSAALIVGGAIVLLMGRRRTA